jgi:hypothetical protein
MSRDSDLPEPAEIEAADVREAVALEAAVSRLGARQLLMRGMNWERLFSSANPPGAMSPESAREQLTRLAVRKQLARRKAFRSGARGLLTALRVA